MDRLEILKKGREILSDASKWTQKQFARGKNNVPCKVNGGKALSYCMDGALERVTGVKDYGTGEVLKARELLNNVIIRDYRDRIEHPDVTTRFCINEFNDYEDTTYDNVVRVYDEAIKLEEAKK